MVEVGGYTFHPTWLNPGLSNPEVEASLVFMTGGFEYLLPLAKL
jgi:hypothetical protein